VALLFWDASALIKRYLPEAGSVTVDALFQARAHHAFATTPWSYAETYSALLRRMNSGQIRQQTWSVAVAALQAEVAGSPDFQFETVEDAVVFRSIALIRTHNLNATDAAILTLLLDHRQSLPPGSPPLVLVASDQRLLRAAAAEGLVTVNPEILHPAQVPGLLAAL
jgi:predicted nucleic acid-binding protein